MANWLRDDGARQGLLTAVRSSQFREHKVSWRAFLAAPGGAGLKNSLDTGSAAQAHQLLLDTFGDLEMYFPVPEHFAAWTGGTQLVVTAYLGTDQPLAGWTGSDLDGREVPLAVDHAPQTPVLVLHRPEGMISVQPVLAPCPLIVTIDACSPGGGPPPPPPGYYLTAWQIDRAPDGSDWDPWPSGGPEFEITFDQIVDFVDNGHIRVSDGNGWVCAASQDSPGSRYWNYDNIPSLESGRVLLLDPQQILRFQTAQEGSTDMLVSENDDTPCADGAYPSVGDRDGIFGNDDDTIGDYFWARPAQFNTTTNVHFGYDPGRNSYNVIRMDFQRIQ